MALRRSSKAFPKFLSILTIPTHSPQYSRHISTTTITKSQKYSSNSNKNIQKLASWALLGGAGLWVVSEFWHDKSWVLEYYYKCESMEYMTEKMEEFERNLEKRVVLMGREEMKKLLHDMESLENVLLELEKLEVEDPERTPDSTRLLASISRIKELLSARLGSESYDDDDELARDKIAR